MQKDAKSKIDVLPPHTDVCPACSDMQPTLCGALSDAEVADLKAISRRKVLSAGKTHTLEGTELSDYARVVAGVAKVVKGADDGRSQIVGLLFPSDFLGGMMEAGDARYEPFTIEAASDIELCLYPRRQFETLLERHPSLETRLLDQALNELHRAREWMVLLGRKSAEERVASFLVHVCDRLNQRGCLTLDSFEIPLSRADIADYVGLTVETVSRQISKLKREKVILMEGSKRIVALDEQKLRARSGF